MSDRFSKEAMAARAKEVESKERAEELRETAKQKRDGSTRRAMLGRTKRGDNRRRNFTERTGTSEEVTWSSASRFITAEKARSA